MCIGLLCIVGRGAVLEIMQLELDADEKDKLAPMCKIIGDLCASVNSLIASIFYIFKL